MNTLLTASERSEENIFINRNKLFSCYVEVVYCCTQEVCFFMNENKRLYQVVVLWRKVTVAALNCALLWFPQQTEELLHLGYFHFWTLR